jgi:hypothetical protein
LEYVIFSSETTVICALGAWRRRVSAALLPAADASMMT